MRSQNQSNDILGSGVLDGPTQPRQRNETIDMLRGFVLCAIALMNIELFTISMRDIDGGISHQLSGVSWLTDTFIYVFLHGKGWALFSMLFGVGFAMMRRQGQEKPAEFTRVWIRRALVLLAIGTAHATLVWSGDILMSYAVVGLALLPLRNIQGSKAALLGAACIAFPLLLLALSAIYSMTHVTATSAGNLADVAARAAEIQAYAHGSFADAIHERMTYLIETINGKLLFLPVIFGMALLGVALFDSGALTRPSEHRRLWMRLLVGCGLAGSVLTATSIALDPDPMFVGVDAAGRTYLATVLHVAGAPLLALAYAAGLVLAMRYALAQRVLTKLAPAGRLALTNYLLQSVMFTGLFYGYGFGLWGGVSRFGQLAIAVVVFALQVRASTWYAARFRYGPAEWLWRWATYGRRPVLRRSDVQLYPVRETHFRQGNVPHDGESNVI